MLSHWLCFHNIAIAIPHSVITRFYFTTYRYYCGKKKISSAVRQAAENFHPVNWANHHLQVTPYGQMTQNPESLLPAQKRPGSGQAG
ncbi:MAG: hypothetical protein AB1461_10165 [Thermodesulfobacteriota bacterium]